MKGIRLCWIILLALFNVGMTVTVTVKHDGNAFRILLPPNWTATTNIVTRKMKVKDKLALADIQRIHQTFDITDINILGDTFYCNQRKKGKKTADEKNRNWMTYNCVNFKTKTTGQLAVEVVTRKRKPEVVVLDASANDASTTDDTSEHKNGTSRKRRKRRKRDPHNYVNSSIFLGVYWNKFNKKWAATVRYEGKRDFLGYFTNEKEAARRYDKFIIENGLQEKRRMNFKSQVQLTSKYKGVNWHKTKKKWKAQIQINGKKKYLGYFNDEKSAAKAYDMAIKAYKLQRLLNFP